MLIVGPCLEINWRPVVLKLNSFINDSSFQEKSCLKPRKLRYLQMSFDRVNFCNTEWIDKVCIVPIPKIINETWLNFCALEEHPRYNMLLTFFEMKSNWIPYDGYSPLNTKSLLISRNCALQYFIWVKRIPGEDTSPSFAHDEKRKQMYLGKKSGENSRT